jgi:thiosulfate dehydrogenase
MRTFVAGVVTGLVLSGLTAVTALWFWPWQVNATATPGTLETQMLRRALDRSVTRQAPRLSSPLPATDENLMAGMKFYRDGCSGCHGTANKPSTWGTTAFYPRVPQFGLNPPRRPDWQTFWIVKNGVRDTGMGAWGNLATDEQIWQVSMFLSRLEALPSAVAAEWQHPHGG